MFLESDVIKLNFNDTSNKIVPNNRQLNILEMGYYNFIHFGLNTYTGKEWGDGNVDPKNFKLKQLDTDKWVQDLMSTGSKGVIITAKHHDGFCLFNSKYTDYCIRNTPYKSGQGDIVKELSESCKKFGFKLGIYLSPWDRHEPTYGTEAYNDYFCNQLEELCTNYGDIFCFWFDGACGEGKNGKKQRYDWERYYATIHKYQPNAALSNCGPDIRWIGNESGKARKAEWSVVPKRLQVYDEVMRQSQQEEGAFKMLSKIDHTDKRLGDRDLISENEPLCYWPSEMDVPITYAGWFYYKYFEITMTRSVKNLLECYYTSVGNNATLLVNIPPNKKGDLPKKFINRLKTARKCIENDFAKRVDCRQNQIDEYTYELSFNTSCIQKAILREDITQSQRVEKFKIIANGITVFKGETIGYKKICFFESVKTNKIIVKITQSRNAPVLLETGLYK